MAKITVIFPPLLEGSGNQRELPGTTHWCSFVPQQSNVLARGACVTLASIDFVGFVLCFVLFGCIVPSWIVHV